jgi:2-dehydropantoate 2-reductase
VARALRAGGLPARAVDDVSAASQWGTVVTVALVASLEAAGWRFDEVRPGELSAAIDEAVRVLEGHLGARRPLALRAVGPLAVRLVRAGARLPLVPLDLQTYLQVHFTKVGAQTRQHLGDLLAWSEAEGVAVPRLRELHDVLQASTLTSP